MSADALATLESRQSISRDGIDPQSRNIPSPASEELRVSVKLYGSSVFEI